MTQRVLSGPARGTGVLITGRRCRRRDRVRRMPPWRFGLALVAAVGTAACSNGAPSRPITTQVLHQAASAPGTAPSEAAGGASLPNPTGRRAVVLGSSVVVHRAASASSEVVTRLSSVTPLGSPRVLLTGGIVPGWVEVLVPTRPNGAKGWVAGSSVRLEDIDDLITVDLTTHRMTMVVAGVQVADTSVAVGSTANPTPRGRFFVTDRVRPPVPDGTYGAFALGLSAHSPTLSEFDYGDGQIGIHGTNVPTSIGKAVSHGCIRVPADVAPLLARIPLGTPVVIR